MVFISPDHKAGYFLGVNVTLGGWDPLGSHDIDASMTWAITESGNVEKELFANSGIPSTKKNWSQSFFHEQHKGCI